LHLLKSHIERFAEVGWLMPSFRLSIRTLAPRCLSIGSGSFFIASMSSPRFWSPPFREEIGKVSTAEMLLEN
jgi:hypothetical protein